MKYKKITDNKVFGFGIFVPKRYYPYILKYKREIGPYINWFIKKDYKYPRTNSMRMHITIKYLGYHKKYSNKEILRLAPKLKEISLKYLPLEVKVRGIKVGTKHDDVGVLLNFKRNPKIDKFHNEIINSLGKDIDNFENIDGKNFAQHITISSGQKTHDNIKNLRRIARESKFDKEIKIVCGQPYIFLKKIGPIKI